MVNQKRSYFFKKEFPFIGYVQVLAGFDYVRNVQKLKFLQVAYSWGVDGLQRIPKDQSKLRKNTEDRWLLWENLISPQSSDDSSPHSH